MTGFVLFAHGSRVETANQAVRDVAAQVAARGKHVVEPAFLELGKPDLAGAVERLVAAGAGRIVVIPYFLTLGTHLQRDLPKLVSESAAVHGHVEFEVTPPLDGHPALVEVLLSRAREAVQHSLEAL
jgi:sirohydrochlorin ferrochelatase